MFAPLLRVVPHIGLASQIMLNGVIFPASGSWRRRYFAILRKNPALVLLCSWTYPIWEDGSFSPTKDHEEVEPSIARSRARIFRNSKWRSLVSYFLFFLLDINLAATDTLISVSFSMPLDAYHEPVVIRDRKLERCLETKGKGRGCVEWYVKRTQNRMRFEIVSHRGSFLAPSSYSLFADSLRLAGWKGGKALGKVVAYASGAFPPPRVSLFLVSSGNGERERITGAGQNYFLSI